MIHRRHSVLSAPVLAIVAVTLWAPRESHACPPGVEFCYDGGFSGDASGDGGTQPPPPRDCWSSNEFKDVCNEPAPPCVPDGEQVFTFVDDQDGKDDGQIWTTGTSTPGAACGTLTVTKTAYYRIYDTELSESCSDQKDETGYLRVTNSCNPNGVAVEANSGDRYVVLDSDNSPPCTKDDECQAGRVCREGNNHGRCCVPKEPTFMGTFLLVAGENNRICLYHWCPVWKAEKAKSGTDLGFITAGCSSADSVHFKIAASAIACEDTRTLKPCGWGCNAGTCAPDPCESKTCAAYCKDGVCLQENPCAGLNCTYGCKNGLCLQHASAPGPDSDGDGYPRTADCDDNASAVNPGHPEICGNGKDDNCDGFTDEAGCTGGTALDGGSAKDLSGKSDGSSSGTQPGDGCSCRVGSEVPWRGLALLGCVFFALGFRRRRRG